MTIKKVVEKAVGIIFNNGKTDFEVVAATEKVWSTADREVTFTISAAGGLFPVSCGGVRLPYKCDSSLRDFAIEQVQAHGEEWIEKYYDGLSI